MTHLPYPPESVASPLKTHDWGDNCSHTIYWEVVARVEEQRDPLLWAVLREAEG